MPGHIERGNLATYIDAGQKRTCVTFALEPQDDTATCYQANVSQEELCHALGVDHNAAEYLGVNSIEFCGMHAPQKGMHGFTFHTMDNSQTPTAFKPLDTATRAVTFTPNAAHAYHFGVHSNASDPKLHEPLQLGSDTSDAKLASAAKRSARWGTFLNKNAVTDESIMKGCTTFQSPTSEQFHAVPKLTEAHPEAGALAHLVFINQNDANFKKAHLGDKVIEMDGREYHVLNQESCSALQTALKSHLKPQSNFGDGLRISALRHGDDAVKNKKSPLFATFAFNRSLPDGEVQPLTKSSALQNLEGPGAKTFFEYKQEGASADMTSKLAEQLTAIGIHNATVVKEHN